ncbi:hypothetical protein ACFPH9_14245 [Brevundimonas bullata]|uniref:DUF7684 family protein n=2 Tax=Brevundimonas bullata TaxID=13160 RepID=UPI00360DFC3C
MCSPQAVPDEWQDHVSQWLVSSGCLYMMAWGVDCSSWDDSVDWANLSAAGPDEIPDDKFVTTTWHEDEALSETLWFAANTAFHPTVPLNNLIIIGIGPDEREAQMLAEYSAAQALLD